MSAVKCLVWDLDGTLWRGTLLEGDDVVLADGVLDVLRELDRRGILHSIASRNAHDAAWARLTELGVAEYFLYPQIGWGRKPESVRAVAKELNFALDAMAFVDDQPAELAEMALHLPEVRSYPADLAPRLPALPDFTPEVVTEDARRRRRRYRAEARRSASRAAFAGPDEGFLRSLEMVMRIGPAVAADLPRVAELTQRTSQMNATGVHYPAETLAALCLDPDHAVLLMTLEDRFGPHGAVGVLLAEARPRCWHLKLLATSCRVVSFGAGSELLRWLVDRAAGESMHLVADFRPTERNRIMEVAYRFAGFSDASCECLNALADPAEPGTRRLHLAPAPATAGTAMRVIADPSIAASPFGTAT
jgi:methoxymalonate biosynthesis protein